MSPRVPAAGEAPPEVREGGDKQAWFLRRLWRDHEEGVLYTLAVVVYIGLGYQFKTIFLNWIVGPLFPLLVVYLIPTWLRRLRARWAR